MHHFWQQLPQPILALAPMAGVTDAAFRQMCKQFGADVIYTEFASCHALIHENEATKRMLAFTDAERPVVCQIFGSEPAMMAEAAKIVEGMGFDGIDINFGCPAYKVTKNGGGVCLMRNPENIRRIAEAVSGAVSIPVSIKLRASIRSEDNQKTFTALDVVKAIAGIPIAAIMVHGRSYEKPFDGNADPNAIRAVVSAFPGIVLANGGIYTPEDATAMLKETKAAGLGIGRGSHGKPWIFKQIKDFMKTGTFTELPWGDIRNIITAHAEKALHTKNEWGIIEMRKHLAWYVKGLPHATAVRSQLVRVKALKDIYDILPA